MDAPVRRLGGRLAAIAAITTVIVFGLAAPASAAVPTIASVSPASAPVGCGVTITGSNFQSPLVTGGGAVTFGGVAVGAGNYTVVSDSTIFAIVPAVLTGSRPVVVSNADGSSGEAAFTAVAAPGGCSPTITSFSPPSGPAGCGVTINGTNLIDLPPAVDFNGTAAAGPVTLVSSTRVTAFVPVATDGPIHVTTNIGPVAASAADFNVTGGVGDCAPSITSFSPTSGPIGTAVTITGTNFLGTGSVQFNGVGASFVVLDATHISTLVPLGATTGKIRVNTGVGPAVESATNFIVGAGAPPSPTITNVTPTTGAAGTPVTITGTNLSGATFVRFNGVAAVILNNTDTTITTTVPVGASTGPLTVTTPNGTASGGTFTVPVDLPTIVSFTPSSGPVATPVTITGTNLTGGAVRFNGVLATVISNTGTSISTSVPAGATTGPITVTTTAGTATSASNFTVTVPPTITSFTPTTGPVGTVVTVNGTNFTGATSVKFNNVSAAITQNTGIAIVTSVPAGATTGPITVTTPAGTATSPTNFTVTVLAPTVTSFSPTAGEVGDTITIFGTNLTGATAVRFNGVAASFSGVLATQLTATVPAGASTGQISVTTPGGTGASATDFVVRHDRSLTLSLPGAKAKGNLSADDGFGACGALLSVKLQHYMDGAWHTLEKLVTSVTGAFSTGGVTEAGKFRAKALKTTLPGGDVCKAVTSAAVKQ